MRRKIKSYGKSSDKTPKPRLKVKGQSTRRSKVEDILDARPARKSKYKSSDKTSKRNSKLEC